MKIISTQISHRRAGFSALQPLLQSRAQPQEGKLLCSLATLCNSKQSHRRADLSAFQPHCSCSTHNHRRADICSSASPLQFHAKPQEGRGFQAWIFKKTVQQSLFFSLQFPAMGSRWQRFPGLDLLLFFPPCNFQKWPQDGRGLQAWFVYIQFVYTVYTVFFKLLNY